MRIFGVSVVAIIVILVIGIGIEQRFPSNPIGTLLGKVGV